MDGLARLYAARKQYNDAEASYRRSLEIERAAYGAVHPTVAATLDSYAALLRTQNRNVEADVLAARAMVVRAQWNETLVANANR